MSIKKKIVIQNVKTSMIIKHLFEAKVLPHMRGISSGLTPERERRVRPRLKAGHQVMLVIFIIHDRKYLVIT